MPFAEITSQWTSNGILQFLVKSHSTSSGGKSRLVSRLEFSVVYDRGPMAPGCDISFSITQFSARSLHIVTNSGEPEIK